MNHKRIPKSDDYEMSKKALELIAEMMKLNPQIDNTLWISACLSSVAATFHSNYYSYEIFSKEMEKATDYYKRYWSEK